MKSVVDRIPRDAETDLPFGGGAPAAHVLAALDGPIYVGAVDAGQRGVFGPISLEVMLEPGRIELGPFVLPTRQAARLCRLLELALAVLGEAPPAPRPAPAPESGRGIAGWNLSLARQTAVVAPWEGETRP